MNLQYFYIIWTVVFLLIWATLYIKNKDLRKEMLIMSLLFGVGGIISQYIYVVDWWKPLTITKTLIGIEDFLIGFGIGGIASIIYEKVFKKRIKKKSKFKLISIKTSWVFLLLIFLFLGSFFILNLNSAYSSIIAFGTCILIVFIQRKDLIKNGLITGLMMMVLGALTYLLLNLVYPGFIEEFWYLEETFFSKLFLGIPLGEYLWYFLAGTFIGPLYEFWQEERLENQQNP